eukprot:429081-Pyramimonas_sp.AAC.1
MDALPLGFGDAVARRLIAQPSCSDQLPRSWMLTFAHSRGVFTMIEQPNSSLLYFHPAVTAAMTACSTARVYTCMGGFGAPSAKPTELMTTFPEHTLHKFQKTSRDAKSCQKGAPTT